MRKESVIKIKIISLIFLLTVNLGLLILVLNPTQSQVYATQSSTNNNNDCLNTCNSACSAYTNPTSGSTQDGDEIVSLRNAHSKTFQNSDGSRTLRAYQDFIHYQGDDGNWYEVNTTIKPSNDPNYAYQMQDSMYKVRLKKYFNDKDFLEVAQKGVTDRVTALPLYWENEKGQKELIAYPQHVEGYPQGSSIIYTDAYGPGLDFRIDLANAKFDKWLIIDNLNSLGNGPSETLKAGGKVFLNAPLEISFSDNNIKLSQNGKNLLPLNGLTTTLLSSPAFDVTTNLEVSGGSGSFSMHQPFYQENTSLPTNENLSPLEWRISQPDKSQPDFQMDFLLAQDNLQKAKYPLIINSDTQYQEDYLGAYMRGYSTTYSTARSTVYQCNNCGASSFDYTGQSYASSYYTVWRSFVSFGTSAIGAGSTVTSAKLYVRAYEDQSTTDFNFKVYRYAWVGDTAGASCTNKTANWAGAYGSGVLEGTLRSTSSGWVSNTWYNLTLATAGINKTGNSKYVFVSDRDVSGTQPSGNEYVRAYTSGYPTNPGYQPYLDITYTAPLPNGSVCTVGGDCASGNCINSYCCNTACGGNCDRCNVAGSLGTCTNVDADCTGNCDVCSGGNCAANVTYCTGNCDVCNGSGTAYSCAASAALCTGNCDDCSGSGTAFNCAANVTYCTGNCDVCNGSGTAYSCAADQSPCSACYDCSGSGTAYSCASVGNTEDDTTGTQCNNECTYCTGGLCTNVPQGYESNNYITAPNECLTAQWMCNATGASGTCADPDAASNVCGYGTYATATYLTNGTGGTSKCCGDDAGEDFEQTAAAGASCCYNASVLSDSSSSGAILCEDGQLYDCNSQVAIDGSVDTGKVTGDQVGTACCGADNTWSAGSCNQAPSFTAGPSDGSSSGTTPTNVGSNVSFTATATDTQSNSWQLVICKTNSVTPSSTSPSCPGGLWCVDGTWRGSGVQSSCNYTAQAGDAESNVWYAFACDNNSSSPLCSATSQGSGDNGSPFNVNHAPSFTAVNDSPDPVSPSGTVTITTTASDSDTNTVADTVKLYICQAADGTSSGCGAGGTWCSAALTSSNPTCNFTAPAMGGIYNYYAYVYDSHNFASASNYISSTFSLVVGGCNPSPGGDVTITTACSFPDTANHINGVDSGTGTTNTAATTIGNGGTLTVLNGQTLAMGKFLTVGTGKIIMIDGGKLLTKTPLWMVDSNVDGRPDNTAQYAQIIAPTNGRRRNVLTSCVP